MRLSLPEHDSPARRVLEVVARQGPISTAEIVAELGVTRTAVRQQTTRLAAESWLERSHRRGATGRPADEWRVSAEGRRRFASADDELLRLVLSELRASHGADAAEGVLRRVGARLVEKMRAGVGDGAVEARVKRLAALFEEQGLLVNATDGGATRLNVFTCPYPEASSENPHICEMERKAIEELLGSNVELGECLRDGGHCCSFHVKAERNAGEATRAAVSEPVC